MIRPDNEIPAEASCEVGAAGQSGPTELSAPAFVAILERHVIARVERFAARIEAGGEPTPEHDQRLAESQVDWKRAEARLPANAGWYRFTRDLGLDGFETEVLAYLLCMAESARLQRVVGAIKNPSGGWNTIGRIIDLLVDDPVGAFRARRSFSLDGRLFAGRLVEEPHMDRVDSLLEAKVQILADVAAAILGDDAVFGHLCPGLQVLRPEERLDQLVVPGEVRTLLRRLAGLHSQPRVNQAPDGEGYGLGTLAFFLGPAGTGKTLAARVVAREAGRPLVVLAGTPGRSRWFDPAERLAVAMSQAQREDAVLLIDECDTLLDVQPDGTIESPELLTLLEEACGLVILATNRPARLAEAIDRRLLYKVRFPLPDATSRAAIWRIHLPEPLRGDDPWVEELAKRHRLTGGYIKNATKEAQQALAAGELLDARTAVEHAARNQGARALQHYDQVVALEQPGAPSDEVQDVAHTVRALRTDPRARRLRELGLPAPLVLLHGRDTAALRARAAEIAGAAGLSWLAFFDGVALGGLPAGGIERRMNLVGEDTAAAVLVDGSTSKGPAGLLAEIASALEAAPVVFVLYGETGGQPGQAWCQAAVATVKVAARAPASQAIGQLLERAGIGHGDVEAVDRQVPLGAQAALAFAAVAEAAREPGAQVEERHLRGALERVQVPGSGVLFGPGDSRARPAPDPT